MDSQEKRRRELINGEVVTMPPSSGWNHVITRGNIYIIFANYLHGKKSTPVMHGLDGLDLYLTEKDIFIPDFMVVCDPDKIKQDGVYGAPDLVVEVPFSQHRAE